VRFIVLLLVPLDRAHCHSRQPVSALSIRRLDCRLLYALSKIDQFNSQIALFCFVGRVVEGSHFVQNELACERL